MKEKSEMPSYFVRIAVALSIPLMTIVISWRIFKTSHGIIPLALFIGILFSIIWGAIRFISVNGSMTIEVGLLGLFIIVLGNLIAGVLEVYGSDMDFYRFYYIIGVTLIVISGIRLLITTIKNNNPILPRSVRIR